MASYPGEIRLKSSSGQETQSHRAFVTQPLSFQQVLAGSCLLAGGRSGNLRVILRLRYVVLGGQARRRPTWTGRVVLLRYEQ